MRKIKAKTLKATVIMNMVIIGTLAHIQISAAVFCSDLSSDELQNTVGGSIIDSFFNGLKIVVNKLENLLTSPTRKSFLPERFSVLRNLFGPKTDPLYSDPPQKVPPKIISSEDPKFQYEARSPYYKVFFKDAKIKVAVGNSWVEFKHTERNTKILSDESSTESILKEEKEVAYVAEESLVVNENSITFSNIFKATDLSYVLYSSLLKEAFVLKQQEYFDKIVQEISWKGVTPAFQEDGSIIFSSDKPVLRILPPSMIDAEGNICFNIYYELIETGGRYELHTVIDEKGLEWLHKAVYPVTIDPSMETFEDAWESSGFQPYNQYFRNLAEYVNPSNGHLMIGQTDLVIPGRGLDLVISRVYETLAISYQAEPYDYTPPPVNVGKGWKLGIPYIGEDYLYLWGGTAFKIEWSNNTFENHKGSHFILTKNGDNTYTLTTADGTVCEFSEEGDIESMRDLDQNTITFNYTEGNLTSITDTVGRVISFTYSGTYLKKITYNGAEVEYGYNDKGNLIWMDDFLDRRTEYYYDSGWTEYIYLGGGPPIIKSNVWLLSKIEYPTDGYSTYEYNRFSYNELYGGTGNDIYKYYVTEQKICETDQVQRNVFSYNGNFEVIVHCSVNMKDESDVTQGSYEFSMWATNGLIASSYLKNASGTTVRTYAYTYSSRNEITQTDVYLDGSTLSYSDYYLYDNWGNLIYRKDAEGHEQFSSFANTSTSGFFVNNSGELIRQFTNAFSNDPVPSSVHTALLGTATVQDDTFVNEKYLTYDSEAHAIQSKSSLGNATTWLTYSGTFNEKTGDTSFPIDLTGHTVAGNAVLQITGLPSDDTFQESHSASCNDNPSVRCTWNNGYWLGKYYKVHWGFCLPGIPPDCDSGWASIGPFTHYPGTLGYQSYTTNPSLGGKSNTFTVTTKWKAYPAQVEYNLDGPPWEIVTTNLGGGTARKTVPITDGTHTLNFTESSSVQAKFSWTLYVPVDNLPDTYTTSTTHDAYGNIISTTDDEGHSIAFEYSAQYGHAYLTRITDGLGETAQATYDLATGNVLSITNPRGYTTTYEYDVLNRITKCINPDLTEKRAVYDDINNHVTLYDELNHFTRMYYDNLGRLIEVTYYLGGQEYASETLSYNYMNRKTQYIDTMGHVFTYEYDVMGRVVRFTKPDTTEKTFQYDDTNNTITFWDENQHKSQQKLDMKGRVLWVKEFVDETNYYLTQNSYDQSGHLTTITDAKGSVTTYEYASLFGVTQVTYPDNTSETYTYDGAGNLTSKTDANGSLMTFVYDAAFRITEIHYPDETSITYEYDELGNRTLMTDPAGVSTYVYDSMNRLVSQTRTIDGVAYTTETEYNTVSRPISITYPEGTTITFVYDDLNRVTSIPGYADFSYNVKSQVETVLYGNGVELSVSYSPCCIQPLRIRAAKDGTDLLDLIYTYDSVGNITQLENGGFNPETQIFETFTELYSYDWLNRLTSATTEFGSFSYSYDSVGNRTSLNETGYTYNSVNELISMSDGTTFSYDNNGNMISRTNTDTWTYYYSYDDELTEVQRNGQVIDQYTYDGDGKRIKRQEWVDSLQAFQTTVYVHSGVKVLYEKNIDTETETIYVYGPTGRVAKKTDGSIYYFINDQVGSTRLKTDQQGNVVTKVDYRPFGADEQKGGSEEYSFTSKEKDASGLYYYGSRYYDPELGRFITRDVVEGELNNPQSLNRYTYCLNNPLKFIDPWGYAPSVPGGDCACATDPDVIDILDALDRIDVAIDEYDQILDGYANAAETYIQDFIDKCKDWMNDMGMGLPELIVEGDISGIVDSWQTTITNVFDFLDAKYEFIEKVGSIFPWAKIGFKIGFKILEVIDYAKVGICVLGLLAIQEALNLWEEAKRIHSGYVQTRNDLLALLEEKCECAIPEEHREE